MNASSVTSRDESLEAFVGDMAVSQLADRLSSRCMMSRDEAEAFLRLYANEMNTTLNLLAGIRPGFRILDDYGV